ncbi:MAG TPA: xanthine dehydrogenase family protein subunit M [Xanthobacteraceae bacterium]|nr:xanthine dehydrogenase family protein subunit M [Xanthobacteraceae bacterium]
MKPAPFEYERPDTVVQALEALAIHGERAKVLAGGQSLIPMLNLRVLKAERLIDIGRLDELRYVKDVGDEIRIGALTTHNAVMNAELVRTACPIIAEAYRQVSHHSVRNRGTIGGSLCHNDPAAEMPLVMNLVSAILIARSAKGEREIAASEFFTGTFSTVLGADELLVEIRVPKAPARHGWSFQEISQRKGDFALLAAGAMLTLDAGRCQEVRIGYCNAGLDGFRLAPVEALLRGKTADAALLSQAGELAMHSVDPPADVHADAQYRRDLVRTLTVRVLSQALGRTGHGS